MKIKNIIFDFDGVIIDSMKIREDGFREIFKVYPKEYVDKLIEYHNINGGLSRFNKIEYFYDSILKKEISQEQIKNYADEFSDIMRKYLVNKNNLIDDCVAFIHNNYNIYSLHIASGSEHNELNYLCKELDINKYFKSIVGSPTTKTEIVCDIIENNNYKKEETILIGDSINDYEAAKSNNIRFFAYNNKELEKVSDYYIDSFYKIDIFK